VDSDSSGVAGTPTDGDGESSEMLDAFLHALRRAELSFYLENLTFDAPVA
jgi:hypothetical protein